MRRQAGAHWIIKNVIAMFLVICRVADAMVRRFGLPDSAQPQFAPRCGCIPAFDVLDGLLQRNPLLGCNDEMKVIGHDYELVEFESSFAAIEIERVNQQFGGVCILENACRLFVTDLTKKVLIS